jgi:pterin-4a-carbinolamine dehydratase
MPNELTKLADEEIQVRLQNLPHWEIDNRMLQRRFTLPSFPAPCSLPVLSLMWQKSDSIILT